jgi:NAD(P)-dependent dehydrogenase (short-subunit alcohol dehydrogenase family)
MKLPLIAALMELRNKVALVTGGASGIGKAICFRLAELGADICIADRSKGPATAAVRELLEQFPTARVTFADCDLGELNDAEALVDRICATFGKLDILINNAAIFAGADSLALNSKQLTETTNIILNGPTILASKAAQHMSGRKSGVIINIATPPKALPNMAPYLAAKHGVIGMTKALALDCGPMGVRVLAISPTLVDTPGMREKANKLAAAGVDLFGGFSARLPLRRVGQPDDIARVVAFCATDMASFITGTNILVDGGDSIA